MPQTDSIHIPETPEQLTPQWLTSALRRGGLLDAGRVMDVRWEQVGDGEGFLGDVLRLHLSYDAADTGPAAGAAAGAAASPGPEPATLIAKLPKLANRAMGELLGAYERENCFYRRFASQLPIRTPRLYYGEFDPDPASERQEAMVHAADRLPRVLNNPMTNLARWIARRKQRRYVLLLEDITDATPGDQVAGASVERCGAALRTIASVHAAFWQQPTLGEEFWLLPLDVDARLRHSMFRRSRPMFEQAFQDEMAGGLGRYLDRVENEGVEMMRSLCAAPATLLHCDLRLDNLFFGVAEVIVFDWQLARRGPSAYDVAYFLSGALDEASEPEDVEHLLRTYHTALGELGVSGYSLDALRGDYRLGLHNVLQTLATTDQVELGDGRGEALMRTWVRRLHARLQAADAIPAP